MDTDRSKALFFSLSSLSFGFPLEGAQFLGEEMNAVICGQDNRIRSGFSVRKTQLKVSNG